jgi:hypothetical protein
MRKKALGTFIVLVSSHAAWGVTFDDIARQCEATFYEDDENHGDISCGSELRGVERHCSAYRGSFDADFGYIECSGEYRWLDGECEIIISDGEYGEISC